MKQIPALLLSLGSFLASLMICSGSAWAAATYLTFTGEMHIPGVNVASYGSFDVDCIVKADTKELRRLMNCEILTITQSTEITDRPSSFIMTEAPQLLRIPLLAVTDAVGSIHYFGIEMELILRSGTAMLRVSKIEEITDVGPEGPEGPMGPTGPQGQAGVNGTTILSGVADPTSADGADGDFYIRTDTNTLFGPKTAGSWNAGISLVGPQGSVGQTGPVGATGPQGPMGPTGAAGLQGPAGPTGATGATGATGPQGPMGPMGPQGSIGLTGATGATGPQGPAGPVGATGATGPQGPAGVTNGSSRIVSGFVRSDGSIMSGSGFTASQIGTTVRITFASAFSGFPHCTATALANGCAVSITSISSTQVDFSIFLTPTAAPCFTYAQFICSEP